MASGPISSFQSLSHVWFFATPWIAAHKASLSITNSCMLLKQTHVHWVGDAIQPSYPLPSPSPAFNLSQHQGIFQWVFFSSGGQSIGVSASASALPMNIQDWFPLGLTGLIFLQSSRLSRVFSNTTVQKASILQCSVFFMVQFLNPYMTTGKTIALSR